jgi:hypothetical protein
MNQNIWGPNLWFSLHTMTFVYPLKPNENDKKNYKLFFESLKYTIPCSICRKNYIRHWKEYPIDKHLNSRKELVYWLIDLHNIVNSETGKKVISYTTVIQKYEKVYGKKLILEGTQDMDESEQSLSHNLLYDEQNIAICVQQYFNYSWVKILLIIFFILLILCFIKKYYLK